MLYCYKQNCKIKHANMISLSHFDFNEFGNDTEIQVRFPLIFSALLA